MENKIHACTFSVATAREGPAARLQMCMRLEAGRYILLVHGHICCTASLAQVT